MKTAGCFLEAPRLDSAFWPNSLASRQVLLINPFYPKDRHASFGKHVLTPTLALTSIAAATPSHWNVSYWDENLLQGHPPREPFPAIVGITVHLTFASRAYELADWYRERGAIVVLGGLHVTACPEEAMPHADILVTGEGVSVWRRVLQEIEAGDYRPYYSGSFRDEFADAPVARRDLLPRESFLTTTSLNATRGCHSRCGFCFLATQGLHMPYQTVPPQQIVDEWEQEDTPYAVFTDNNLGSKPGYLRELCQALRPLERIWSAAVSLDVADDPETVREMALAGCTGVFVGFESLSDANIREQNKRSPTTDCYSDRVKLFHDYGIQVNGSFVFGFDHDDPGVFDRTIEWVESHRLECATFHLLTPYPGTPLFRQMASDNRLLHRDWNLYDTAHVVFRPKLMTPEELQLGYERCYRRLFSTSSIWLRRPQEWRSVPAYLAMSYLYKKSNWLWHLLIQHRLTHQAWQPLVEMTRRRHVKYRRQLAARSPLAERVSNVISAGV